MSAPTCSSVAGSGLQNGLFSVGTAGTVGFGNFSTLPSPQTGIQGLFSCTFTDAGTGTLTTTTSVTVAASANDTDLVPRILINDVP